MNKYKGMYRIHFDNKADFKEWLEYLQEKRKKNMESFWDLNIPGWLEYYDKYGANEYFFEDYRLDVCHGDLEYSKSEGLEVVDFTKREYITWGNQVIRIYNMLRGE